MSMFNTDQVVLLEAARMQDESPEGSALAELFLSIAAQVDRAYFPHAVRDRALALALVITEESE